jgi:hypothetical protein
LHKENLEWIMRDEMMMKKGGGRGREKEKERGAVPLSGGLAFVSQLLIGLQPSTR